MFSQPTTMETEGMESANPGAVVAELARAHGHRVYLAAYRVLGDAALAEDVQQNVFLRLLEKPRSGVDSWPAYLSAVATRAAIDELRRRSRWSRLTPARMERLTDNADCPENRLAKDRRARSLRRALGGIRPLEGTCFALRYFQGMELGDIASTLDMTSNHVSVTLNRAVKSIRASLDRLNEHSEENQS